MESPNNGHIGDMAFVRCREVSTSQRLLNYYIRIPQSLSVVVGLSDLGDAIILAYTRELTK